LIQIEKALHPPARWFNWIAAIAVTAMMLLTCADVLLRILRCPIPGTYEIVGLLGATFVSFSLAHTTTERGHIAVDFIVQKLPLRLQDLVDCINSIICALLFAVITWQSVVYALDLKNSGEVSMTLQMPIHPFVFGIALGCGMLSLVLFLRSVESTLKFIKSTKQS
jgi:TRAP-type C4-dicarboxylate transport system permease small subunit